MSRPFCDYYRKIRYEPRRGAVVGFSRLSSTALQSMKEDLGLSMTVGEMQYCQSMYGSSAHNTPILDEIYFLDGIAEGRRRSKSFAAIAKFHSNSLEAARTYRDLMEKRQLLYGSLKKAPPSFESISAILADTLRRSGKTPVLGSYVPIGDPFEAISAVASGLEPCDSLSVGDTLPAVRLFCRSDAFLLDPFCMAKENDAIMLLSNRNGVQNLHSENALNTAFLRCLASFAKTSVYRKAAHAYRTVDHRGVAVALVSLYEGIYTELSEIPSVFDDGELYDLSISEHGSILVAIPQNDIDAFSSEAEHHGLQSVQIARAIRGQNLTVRKRGHAPFVFKAQFIRDFASVSIPFLFEGSPPPKNDFSFPHAIRRNSASSDLAASERNEKSVLKAGELLCSAAGNEHHSYVNGINTALCAVFEAVLSGAALSELSIMDIYAYPSLISAANMGKLLEAFLGVYRVLAELALPNRASFLPRSNAADTLSGFSVHCFRHDKIVPKYSNRFTMQDSSVYLLTPGREGIECPDFRSVRELLHLLEELVRNGNIRSFQIGVNAAPISVIEAMCGDYRLRYTAPDTEDALSAPVHGVFVILEANTEIKKLEKIGTLCANTENVSVSESDMLSIEKEELRVAPVSRRKYSAPTVLLIPCSSEGNLYGLSELFRRNGCAVRILSSLAEDIVTDDVQIVIFCGNSKDNYESEARLLKNAPRSIYALEALIQNDGIILLPRTASNVCSSFFPASGSVSSVQQFMGSGVYLHDGLTDATVKKLLSYYL